MNAHPGHPETHPAQPLAAASRLMAGGLSLLLIIAFALAAGVPANQLLATVGGESSPGGSAGLDRAVAPQIVERRATRSQQERPLAGGVNTLNDLCGCDARTDRHGCDTANVATLEIALRESLLALPPPAR